MHTDRAAPLDNHAVKIMPLSKHADAHLASRVGGAFWLFPFVVVGVPLQAIAGEDARQTILIGSPSSPTASTCM